MNSRSGYVNIDELQAQHTLAEAAAKCGQTLDASGAGKEVRIDCPFGCPGDHAGRREISVNSENPQRVFCCHAYSCQFRGNLLTLMHGWVTGRRPVGDKLKGEEFNRVKQILASNMDLLVNPPAAPPPSPAQDATPPAARNAPLVDSPDSKIRELATLHEKLVTDVAAMSPPAASYVRRHESLTPESMQKWQTGYLPQDGGGDKRGWSLRSHLLYPILSEDGKVLAWAGRDPTFERKEIEYDAIVPAERTGKTPPHKHKFPKGFHRGQELFGQQASRLKEPGYRDFLATHGILVVEGFNDVIGLDNLGIPSVAIMSSKITAAQVAKVTAWAQAFTRSKVALLFDCDNPGDEGAKEALWAFAQQGLSVRLAWSREMHGGQFAGRQPESLLLAEFDTHLRPLLAR